MHRPWAAILIAAVALSPAAAAAEPTLPHITGIAHLALYAHDVEKARIFYKDFLGYAEPFDVRQPDGSLSATFFKINDRQYVELSPEKEVASDRLSHVAFETDDAEALRLALKAKGAAVPDAVAKTRTGDTSFSIQDPDGHTLGFVQYEGAGRSRRETGKAMPAAAISVTLRHVGVLVGSLEPALVFYRDVLGFSETWRGSRDGQVLNWVNMKVPDGGDYVEFMLYRDLPEPTQRGTAHHMCLEVADIEAAKATLTTRTARAGYAQPLEIRTGINRKRQLNLYDPDGTRAELMEPRTIDGVPTPPATAPPPR